MSSDARSPTPPPSSLQLCSCSPSTVRALENPVRRSVLHVLLTQGAVSSSTLASALTGDTEPLPSTPFETLREAMVMLRHVHLPKLEDADLARVEAETVSPGPHVDVHNGPLTAPLLGVVRQDVWSAVAAASSSRLRRAVVDALARSGPTLTLGQVADVVTTSATQSAETVTGAVDGTTDTTELLHHLHLPVLAEVGLVTYDYGRDHGRQTVSYTGRQWFDLDEFAEALARAPPIDERTFFNASHD